MDAALSLVWEQSYGAITIDDICKKAEVKKGSFYYFFDSKAELAVAALDRYWKEQKPLWDRQFSPSVAPLQRIRDHCDAVYAQQAAAQARTGRVPGCPFCTLGSEVCKQDEAIRAKVCEILESKLRYWMSALSDAMREGVLSAGDVGEKARCAGAYFEGLVAQARLHNDAEMLVSLGDRVCEHILRCGGGARSPDAARIPKDEKGGDPGDATRPSEEEFDSTLY